MRKEWFRLWSFVEIGFAAAKHQHRTPGGIQHTRRTLRETVQKIRQLTRLRGIDGELHELVGVTRRGQIDGVNLACAARRATYEFRLRSTHGVTGIAARLKLIIPKHHQANGESQCESTILAGGVSRIVTAKPGA